MNSRKGFTLTELLVVIGMIAVLGTIIIYSTIGINNSSKDLQYERMIENIKNATKTYVSLYPEEFSDLFSSRAFTYVPLNAVKEAGLIDEEITNPYTNKPLDFEQICTQEALESSKQDCLSKVKVYVDGDSYEMMYQYPITKDDIGNQVWLQYGSVESYEEEGKGFTYVYAFAGLEEGENNLVASTAFALADETGAIIKKGSASSYYKFYTNPTTYHLTYEMPNTFVKCTDSSEVEACKQAKTKIPKDSNIGDFYYPTETGTFEITYNWSYTIGSTTYNRSNKRTVKVISATEREKEKLSTNAKTTTKETTTANANGVVAQFLNQNLNGNTKIDTGVELLESNSTFTLFIEGTITKHENDRYLLDIYDSSNGSGFRICEQKSNGNPILRINTYKGAGWGYTNAEFTYKPNKKFRMVISRNENDTRNVFEFGFDYDLDDPNNEVKQVSISYDRYRSTNKTLIIGGLRNNSAYVTGHIDKVVIFNKQLMDLINTGY